VNAERIIPCRRACTCVHLFIYRGVEGKGEATVGNVIRFKGDFGWLLYSHGILWVQDKVRAKQPEES
jgi:hypothetical protein